MPMQDLSIVKNRTAMRSDMTLYLTHLTNGVGEEAYENLWSILEEKKLKSNVEVLDTDPVVCFQDIPLLSIAENLRFEKRYRKETESNRIRYYPFGVRVRKEDAFKKGVRPVVYEMSNEYKNVLTKENYWRYVSLDYSTSGAYVDWTHEREWRKKGDYTFEYKEISVIIGENKFFHTFVEDCFSKGKEELLKSIQSIDTLEEVLF